MFKIITDTTADLPAEFLRENEIDCIALSYILDGVIYGNGKELEPKDFYAGVRSGKLPTTSQANPDEIKNRFEEVSKDYTEVLYLAFSSGLSGTYNSGRLAAEDVMEANPGLKIRVIDTLAASLGEGLIVYKAVALRKKGLSMDEVADYIDENKQHFVHVFTVDDLMHLYRGGRVNKTSAILGTLVGIKPKLHVDSEGHLTMIGKDRGRKKSLNALVDYMGEKLGKFKDENDVIFISHGDCVEDAEYVRDLIKEKYGYENYLFNYIGPTIGAHSGPGTVALFFIGESR